MGLSRAKNEWDPSEGAVVRTRTKRGARIGVGAVGVVMWAAVSPQAGVRGEPGGRHAPRHTSSPSPALTSPVAREERVFVLWVLLVRDPLPSDPHNTDGDRKCTQSSVLNGAWHTGYLKGWVDGVPSLWVVARLKGRFVNRSAKPVTFLYNIAEECQMLFIVFHAIRWRIES